MVPLRGWRGDAAHAAEHLLDDPGSRIVEAGRSAVLAAAGVTVDAPRRGDHLPARRRDQQHASDHLSHWFGAGDLTVGVGAVQGAVGVMLTGGRGAEDTAARPNVGDMLTKFAS